MRFALLLAAFVFAAILGCKASTLSAPAASLPAVLQGSDSEIRDRLLAKIPIGTSMPDAEQIVKSHGLRCSQEIDAKTNEPYLSCGYTDKSDAWVTWVWQICIDCPSGAVSEISCKRSGIGL